MSEVTEILQAIDRGDTSTTDELLPIVYEELRRIAASKLSHEAPGMTLQTTALVHEAYMRLVGRKSGDDTAERQANDTDDIGGATWNSKGHFFAAAAESMRRILIDNARRKQRIKHGGDRNRVEFDNVDLSVRDRSIDLIALDEALAKLEAEDEPKARLVKLRYFAGLTIEQCAKALDVSEPTVKRHWYYARAWLLREMGGDTSGGAGALANPTS